MYEDYYSQAHSVIARRWYPSGSGGQAVDGAVYTLSSDGCIDVCSICGGLEYTAEYFNNSGRQLLRAGDWIVRISGRFLVVSDSLFHVMYRRASMMGEMVI
jgi:hypothetical protein